MSELVRSRPFLGLLLLVILNLFLLSVQIRSTDGSLLLRTWGLAFISPLASAFHSASVTGRELWERWEFLRTVEERNRYLEAENWRLQIELHRLEALRRLVDRDPAFDLLEAQLAGRTVRAGVVWRNLPLFFERVVVNAGTRHGVHRDTAVITPEGVVGRVVAATADSAEVELLSDVNAAAGALVGDERLQGVVQGTGGPLLRLNFIPAGEKVSEGTAVVTSGADGIYPKGIPIGLVVSVDRDAGVYQQIVVRPFVDYTRLEEVALVVE